MERRWLSKREREGIAAQAVGKGDGEAYEREGGRATRDMGLTRKGGGVWAPRQRQRSTAPYCTAQPSKRRGLGRWTAGLPVSGGYQPWRNEQWGCSVLGVRGGGCQDSTGSWRWTLVGWRNELGQGGARGSPGEGGPASLKARRSGHATGEARHLLDALHAQQTVRVVHSSRQ